MIVVGLVDWMSTSVNVWCSLMMMMMMTVRQGLCARLAPNVSFCYIRVAVSLYLLESCIIVSLVHAYGMIYLQTLTAHHLN